MSRIGVPVLLLLVCCGAQAYLPPLPELGKYSLPDVCKPIHDETVAQVTLRPRETLKEAYLRLRAAADPKVGGILNIPWNVSIQRCDYLDVNYRLPMEGGVTIRGIPSPTGVLPKMYCRFTNRDGTVEKGDRQAIALQFTAKGTESGSRALVENIEIDGYSKGVQFGVRHGVLRNSYVHHQPDNGVATSDLDESDPWNALYEFCGNEIAHSGRSNARHNLYLHRHNAPEYVATVKFVDNLVHSADSSSGLKSIANVNEVHNNKFYTTLGTDPSYTTRYGGMLIDIAACARNTVTGNLISGYKHTTRGGDELVGIRNRRNIFGCDQPSPAWEGGYAADEIHAVLGSPQNDPEYWTSLGGEIQFPTIIKNNVFEAFGEYSEQWVAITAMGTYPNAVRIQLQAPTCLLPAPATWYERSRVYLVGNSFQGFGDSYFRSFPPWHWEQCGTEPPPGPGPSDDLFEIDGVAVPTAEPEPEPVDADE